MLLWVLTAVMAMVALYYITGSFFFTFVRENTMKAIVANGRLRRFISNVQGMEIDQSDNTLKKITIDQTGKSNILKPEPFLALPGLEWERWLYNHLGLRWVGFPLFNQVLTIPINRVVWKKDKAESKTTLGRIVVTMKKTHELYHAFPRPIEMSEVDTKDGFRLDLSLLAFIEVYIPYFAFFTLKDSFMITLDSVIKGYVTQVIKGMTWDDFKAKKELVDSNGPEDGLFNFTTLSNRMTSRAGSRVVDLIIDDFSISASSKDLQSAVEANKIADENGKATETTAKYEKLAAQHKADAAKNTRTREGEGDAAAIRAKGAAEADTIIAKGKAAMTRREELIKLYKRMGFNDQTAVEKAIDTVNAELKSAAIGTLTGTYVENGAPVQPTLPLGGRRNP